MRPIGDWSMSITLSRNSRPKIFSCGAGISRVPFRRRATRACSVDTFCARFWSSQKPGALITSSSSVRRTCRLSGSKVLTDPGELGPDLLEGLRDLTVVVDQVRAALNPKLEIGHYLLTMSEGSKKLSVEVEQELRQAFGKKVFRTSIPYNVKLAEAPSTERSVLKHASSSRGAQAYRAVAKELSSGRKPQAG